MGEGNGYITMTQSVDRLVSDIENAAEQSRVYLDSSIFKTPADVTDNSTAAKYVQFNKGLARALRSRKGLTITSEAQTEISDKIKGFVKISPQVKTFEEMPEAQRWMISYIASAGELDAELIRCRKPAIEEGSLADHLISIARYVIQNAEVELDKKTIERYEKLLAQAFEDSIKGNETVYIFTNDEKLQDLTRRMYRMLTAGNIETVPLIKRLRKSALAVTMYDPEQKAFKIKFNGLQSQMKEWPFKDYTARDEVLKLIDYANAAYEGKTVESVGNITPLQTKEKPAKPRKGRKPKAEKAGAETTNGKEPEKKEEAAEELERAADAEEAARGADEELKETQRTAGTEAEKSEQERDVHVEGLEIGATGEEGIEQPAVPEPVIELVDEETDVDEIQLPEAIEEGATGEETDEITEEEIAMVGMVDAAIGEHQERVNASIVESFEASGTPQPTPAESKGTAAKELEADKAFTEAVMSLPEAQDKVYRAISGAEGTSEAAAGQNVPSGQETPASRKKIEKPKKGTEADEAEKRNDEIRAAVSQAPRHYKEIPQIDYAKTGDEKLGKVLEVYSGLVKGARLLNEDVADTLSTRVKEIEQEQKRRTETREKITKKAEEIKGLEKGARDYARKDYVANPAALKEAKQAYQGIATQLGDLEALISSLPKPEKEGKERPAGPHKPKAGKDYESKTGEKTKPKTEKTGQNVAPPSDADETIMTKKKAGTQKPRTEKPAKEKKEEKPKAYEPETKGSEITKAEEIFIELGRKGMFWSEEAELNCHTTDLFEAGAKVFGITKSGVRQKLDRLMEKDARIVLKSNGRGQPGELSMPYESFESMFA